MKKKTILDSALSGYAFLTKDDYQSLVNDLVAIAKDDSMSDEDVAKAIATKMEKLQVLDRATVRDSLSKIARNSATIKHILIAYVIISVIAAIVVVSNM